MSGKIRKYLEGAGIGLFVGLLIGISDQDWMRIILALALITYALNVIKTKSEPDDNSYRIALIGFSAFLSLLTGLYLNGHQILKKSPSGYVGDMIEAGFSPAEAREFYIKQLEWNDKRSDSLSQTGMRMVDSYLQQNKTSDSVKAVEFTGDSTEIATEDTNN